MALNMLVVDDSSAMRKVIKQTLEMTGLPLGQIFQAANGREGLDLLEKEWIDVVFIDINMPIMDGWELIQHIQKHSEWADLILMVVSSETSQTRIQEIQDQNIKFIHKPFTPEEICEKVQKFLGESDSNGDE